MYSIEVYGVFHECYNWPIYNKRAHVWPIINLFLAKRINNAIFVAEYNYGLMIGRKVEFEKLQAAVDKDRAQLIAVYGRRRVGKTFLVNEFFEGKFIFKHTAVSPVDEVSKKKKKNLMKLQLQEFYYSMRSYGLDGEENVPTSWQQAFHMLERLLEKKDNGKRQVIFIDELPWMDTPKANFMPAFEHFCNDWCLARKNLKLVVCGSATSWILDELINNKGGLYGRVTTPIYLSPFTLHECKAFFRADGIQFDEFDICQAYIAFGGIPFYLDQFRKGLSLAQNIDAILYEDNAPLKEEFDRLFSSQFTNPEALKSIVKTLATKRIGYTRDELIKRMRIPSGGRITENLAALEKSKFISEYVPFGESSPKYKLIDPFCIFYLKHVEGNSGNPVYWQTHEKSPAVISWLGLAFEDICWTHIRQIKHALGIDGVITTESPWNIPGETPRSGSRIDLIIKRDDRFVCMCEMKFTRGEFEVNKSYNTTLLDRSEKVREILGNKKTVMSVLVTTYGLKRNEYASRFDRVITMEDLFQK